MAALAARSASRSAARVSICWWFNLYVVLSARGLAPRCRLIARSDSDEAARKLRQAGADQVVSPYVAGGRTMAATALRPLAVTFMELLGRAATSERQR